MISTLTWINLLLIVIIIIYLIVITIIHGNNHSQTENNGVPLNQIFGVQTGTSESFTFRGNYIYIGQSNVTNGNPFILNVGTSDTQVSGQISYVKNTTSNNMIIRADRNVFLNFAGLNSTVESGQTAAFMATNSQGSWIRLE
jgi:hypothetical protein